MLLLVLRFPLTCVLRDCAGIWITKCNVECDAQTVFQFPASNYGRRGSVYYCMLYRYCQEKRKLRTLEQKLARAEQTDGYIQRAEVGNLNGLFRACFNRQWKKAERVSNTLFVPSSFDSYYRIWKSKSLISLGPHVYLVSLYNYTVTNCMQTPEYSVAKPSCCRAR